MPKAPDQTVSPQETIDWIAAAAVRFASQFKDAGIDPSRALDRIVETVRLVFLSAAKHQRRRRDRGGGP